MRHTAKSLIFFFSLLTIVAFIIGFSSGRYVERINTTYVPPTPTLEPTTMPEITPIPSSFARITMESCGISAVLPEALEDLATAENEYEYIVGDGKMYVSCAEDYVTAQNSRLKDDESYATGSATFGTQTVTTYSSDKSDIWFVRNADRDLVLIETSTSLTPLVQQTLEIE